MATASITAPTSPKKRKPDPRAVVAHYYRECASAKGKRGALRRTGDAFGISDESVRRYVQAEEHAAEVKAATPDELRYEPPPGGIAYQAERERIAAQLAAEQTAPPSPLPHQRHKARPRCHTYRHGETLRVCGLLRQAISSDVAQTPRSTNATRPTAERATSLPPSPQSPQTPSRDYRLPMLPDVPHVAARRPPPSRRRLDSVTLVSSWESVLGVPLGLLVFALMMLAWRLFGG
jgi:hypothetical protein